MSCALNKLNIFFDLDGTILDVSNRYYNVYKDLVCAFGGDPLSRNKYWDLKRNRKSNADILSLSNIQKNIKKYNLLFQKNIEKEKYLSLDKKNEKIDEILEILSKQFNLYIVTLRRSRVNTIKQLDRLNILKYFRDIFSPAKVIPPTKKYHLLKTIKKRRGVIVGDTESDILMAKKIGFSSIIYTEGIRIKKRLINFSPDFLISDLDKLIEIIPKLDN